MINNINYIAIAGDSGGHIFPAIKYINELSKIKNPKNILFITNNVGSKFCDQINHKSVNICIVNSKNKFLFILNIVSYLIPLLIRNKNLNLIGFGGFITTPVLYISKFFNITNSNKIFIHEQNYVLGLANKINYFVADKVFTSFPSSNFNKKEIYVGNFFSSTDKDLEELDLNYTNILLLGGSGGSLELNNILLSKLKKLDKSTINKLKLSVQIPRKFFNRYQENYLKLIKNINFFKFNNNLDYKNYDLIISRSGSGSLNDILYFTDSVHFIPHLSSRDGHQSLNLDFFKRHSNFLEKLEILNLKKKRNPVYFNTLINPFSINKIICYLTR